MKHILPILLFLAAGCGGTPTPDVLIECPGPSEAEQRARDACATLTDAEFAFFWNGTIMGHDSGLTIEDQLSGIPAACVGFFIFDRDSECRSCSRAIIEGVY